VNQLTDNKICIVLPVIDEAENLKYLLPEIHKHFPGTQILVIDDNSIDDIELVIKQNIENGLSIEHHKRDQRHGIGSAHKYGIQYAYENGFKLVCTMDADLTHDPKEIKKMFDARHDNDIIIGSRFSAGGAMENWKLSRKILAKIGNLVTNSLFGMKLDSSSSFRLYYLGEKDFLKVFQNTPNNYDFSFLQQFFCGMQELALQT